MPSFGQTGGSFLDTGSGFGSAFGSFAPSTDNSALASFQSFSAPYGQQAAIKSYDTPSTMGSIGQMLNDYSTRKWGSLYGGGASPTGATGGMPTSLGGDWSGVDQWNAPIQQAASQYGVPANLIKAVMKLESGGDPNAAGASGVWGPMQVNSDAWGYGAWSTDPTANIMKGAEILKYYYDNSGGDWGEALRGYHGYGSDGYTTDQQYADIVMNNWTALNGAGGTAGTGYNPQPINGQWGGNATGNSIVNIAQQYLGTPYVWGGIPGRGDTPTGWDCSGMTYWLDQNYGDGSLPMGSHYQYQYAASTGRLFMDMNQMQPGDLIFFDTGNMEGGGAELNRAGHVAMYIGNGQIIHASNPQDGTIISTLSDYYSQRFIGAMHMGWSGGAVGGITGGMATGGGASTGMSPIQLAMSGQLRGGGAGFPTTAATSGTRWGGAIQNVMQGPR